MRLLLLSEEFFGDQWFQGEIPENILQLSEAHSMAFCELYPIVMACVLWGSEWPRKRILFFCDNMSSVNIINKVRSKISLIMSLVRKLTWCSANNNFTLHAKHIPGVKNNIADALSRFQMTKFRQLAPHAQENPNPCVPPHQLMMIWQVK